ncbi:nacht and ankyrin domain protein [Colletotrichum asianum]|uniref:Nacht and ankyrin domain protein n=1 Tax=Colletotrichum asianum TaxID=702518 RepID=A0A8H3WJR3_9PEZI|nr:nacht and ankyrin domain protein [Colletotrichum asianum]
MEPTDVVDSLRGLVAVADNAFRSTYDFAKDKIDPFMDIKRRDEIRRVATEIQDLAGLLHRLTLVASTFDEDHNQVLDDVYGLRSPKLPQQLFSCRQTLIKLEASLSRRKLTYDVIKQEEDLKSRAKLRWPFTTAWTVDLVQEIGQHKEAVTRALSSNSMNELLQSFSKGKDRHSSNRREVIRRYVMGRCRYSKENSTVTSFFARVDHLEVLTRTVSERTNWTDSHLWITGGPGAGKTTFAPTLIETAIHTHYPDQATAVIFAFCRFSDPRSHECFYFLSTLLAQVAVQHPSAMTILGNYYSELRTRRLVEIPTIERMKAAFFAMTKAFRQILCVIDGADECSDEGDSVTQLMASLASESGNVRLAMVSRYRQGIETTLKGSFGESLCCKEFEPDRKQLEMFAATEIEKMATGANSVFHNLRLKDHIIQSFGSITNPSFRFASCSIEYIARYATTESFHEMSKTLPQNLDAIYKLTLQRWNEQRASTQALIQSALQLTAFSDPPLTSHELCQALSVAGIPGLDADELEYPEVDENEIMDACGIFLTKSTHGEEFGLAHHTVKEFLEQIDPTDSEFAGYRLSESRSRRLLAQYSWNSMGALGLKSSEWAGNYRIFAAMVKGGAQMHDDAIHTFRLRCREWTKYKKEQARLDVATILEILGDMVLQGEAEASAYLTAFRHVVTDMHDIDVPLPALEAVTDDMLVERMKKAFESDSLSALKETGQTPRGQLVLQDDTLDGLLDHAMSNLAANCLSFLLDRFSGSESENVKMGRLLLRCTKNEFEDVLVSLLKHGPKATTTDREGRNIWHLSTVGCESGRILQVLMSTHVGKEDREIALHALDNINGRTPLANALFTGYPDYHEASIILKRCQASKDMLQSARPSVNAIIAGIESSKTLQELHNRGILPVPGDETPLHDLQPNIL